VLLYPVFGILSRKCSCGMGANHVALDRAQ
jgi:hypothetical protein